MAYGSERVIDEIREHAYQISVPFYCLSYYAAAVQMIVSCSSEFDLILLMYCGTYKNVFSCQTLSDFQYIDSSGRDQGSNVRKKSQSLVVLVNDKERIQEVRQKAAANRDK